VVAGATGLSLAAENAGAVYVFEEDVDDVEQTCLFHIYASKERSHSSCSFTQHYIPSLLASTVLTVSFIRYMFHSAFQVRILV
jgi:hypothetical protein